MRTSILLSMVFGAGLASYAGAQAQVWQSTDGPPTGQYVFGVGTGTNTVYTIMFDRAARSNNGGQTWIDITGDLGLATNGSFAGTFLEDGSRLFLARADGVWKTDNGGAHWSPVGGGLPAVRSFNVLRTGPRLFVLLDAFQQPANQLYASDDGGDTWQPVTLPQDINIFAESLRTDGQNLFVTPFFSGLWYRSPDLGATWFPPSVDAPMVLNGGPALVGSTLVVPTEGLVYRSTTGGATWSSSPSSGWDSREPEALVVSGSALLAVYRQGSSSILRSTDMGTTWIPSDAGLPGCVEALFESAAAGNLATYIAGYSGVYRSLDHGLTWSAANNGLHAPRVLAMASTEPALLAVSSSRERIYRRVGEAPWGNSENGYPACSSPLSLTSISGSVYLGTDRAGIFRSTDDGLSLTPLNNGVPQYNGTAGNQYREIGAIASHQGRVFAATSMGTEFFNQAFQFSGGGMLRLDAAGTTWQRINTGYPIIARNSFNQPVYDPAVGLGDAGTAILVGTSFNGIVRSVNLGANWSAANTGLPRDTGGRPPVFSSFLNNNGVVLAGSEGFFFQSNQNFSDRGVFVSTDAGLTWTRASDGLPAIAFVNDLEWLDGVTYAATSEGVFRSFDDGGHWGVVGAVTLPAGECLSLAIHGGSLYASFASRGVWRLDAACPADFNADGFVNGADYDAFADAFDQADHAADVNGDGFVNGDDYDAFAEHFESGC